MAVLTSGGPNSRRDETGSGTAIGVAVIFPMLMLVIVLLWVLTESARIEQGVQAAANRAARAASLCCQHTGGTNGAEEVAKASLAAAASANAHNGVLCSNDFVGSSEVVFIDVSGNRVPNDADADGNFRVVPLGGTVYVFVTCRIPPRVLGGHGFGVSPAERTVMGVATVDPYRYRWRA